MRMRLSVSDEKYDEVKAFLEEKGIEIHDEAEYVLTESNQYPGHIAVRDSRGAKLMIAVKDIIIIESYGHTMEITASGEVYKSSERLYQLMNMLDPAKFLRVSNSVIISVSQIRQIIPTFHMKFILLMNNGIQVDVTRNYYKSFKQFFGI